MLTYYYGTMNSSKTAQALMLRFNYQQKGMNVLLLKPTIDTRSTEVSSRIGLKAEAWPFNNEQNLISLFNEQNTKQKIDAIIVDECQFCTKKQVEELKILSRYMSVFAFGLLINFKSEMFDASKRFVELADNLIEIQSICKCGNKASENARIINNRIVTEGAEFVIGAEETYENMCYWCYSDRIKKEHEEDK